MLLLVMQFKVIIKKKFIIATHNLKNKAFIVYISFISNNSDVYLFDIAQIVFLKVNETFSFILSKYIDFIDVIFKDLVAELLEYSKINNNTIDLINRYQLLYKLIHILELIYSKTLKTYIKINLAKSFSKPFKALANIFIFFIKKLSSSPWLCINCKDLDNLIIKN